MSDERVLYDGDAEEFWNPLHPFLKKYRGKVLRKWDNETVTGKAEFGNTATWTQARPVECEYIFITDLFVTGSRVMVEYHSYDPECANSMYPSADFNFLDEITLQYVPSDMENGDFDTSEDD
jgi:hypothetical protein